MSKSKKIVLYFTPESELTDAQASEMERIPGARQRNAALIDPEHALEKCDAVAGPSIPDSYAHLPVAYPIAPADDEEEEEAEASYEDMNVAQLKKLLTDAQVEFPATAKKAALVALAEQHLTPEE